MICSYREWWRYSSNSSQDGDVIFIPKSKFTKERAEKIGQQLYAANFRNRDLMHTFILDYLTNNPGMDSFNKKKRSSSQKRAHIFMGF